MPITKNAKKALRASDRKAVFNLRRKRVVNSDVKNIQNLVKAGKADEAKKSLSAAYKALDKAAKMNTISKGHASRKKSRLAKAVKRASAK